MALAPLTLFDALQPDSLTRSIHPGWSVDALLKSLRFPVSSLCALDGVPRRVSKREYESQFCLSTVRCESYVYRRCWWTRYYVGTVCVLCRAGWKRLKIFLGVNRTGEARQVMSLPSLTLLQFVFSQISCNSDRRGNFYETNSAVLDIRKHSNDGEVLQGSAIFYCTVI